MEETKQHSISRNMKQMHDFRVKASSFDGDLMAAAGLSWPPRSYVCSFCKREFRSAQALGGHMNVHRRDRARLRQSPPRDPTNNGADHFSLQNLNFEPNPSFHPLLSASRPPLSSEMKKCGGDPPHYRRLITADFMKLKGVHEEPKGFVSLELGMGLMITPSKEKLDLELRLGYN